MDGRIKAAGAVKMGKAVATMEIADMVEFLPQGDILFNRIRHLEAQLRGFGTYSIGGGRVAHGGGYRTNAGFTRMIDAKVSLEQNLKATMQEYAQWYVDADTAIDEIADGQVRRAMKMCVLERYGKNEIADKLGCKPKDVGKLLESGCSMMHLEEKPVMTYEVKEYLGRYQEVLSRLNESDRDIARLEEQVERLGSALIGERLESKKAERESLKEEAGRLLLETDNMINNVSDKMQRECLKLRYLDNMSVDEIAREVHYGKRTVERRLLDGYKVLENRVFSLPMAN